MFLGLDYTMIFQLLTAFILGGFLGLERERVGKVAGVRTFSLVSLSSALYVIVSQNINTSIIKLLQVDPTIPATAYGLDPTRILGQIVLGIGFLGAGIIIHHGYEVIGLTTAASLWTAAAVGAAVGFGFYGLAILSVVLALIILHVVSYATKEKYYGQKTL